MKKIIHIDMDSFFASVEIRDNPKLKNKPVLITRSVKRGVVATCSYDARKYGIHSGMPTFKALELCPKAIIVPPKMEKYKSISKKIKKIFLKYSDKVEMVSIDEAYIDVTNDKLNLKSAILIANLIKQDIAATLNLTASAGVSYNKFLAKIASDWNKPNGIFIILPGDAEFFLEKLPIRKFHGIGAKKEAYLKKKGIIVGADLKKMSINELVKGFGKNALFFYNIVRGVDNREVIPFKERKSIGKETTFSKDLVNFDDIVDVLKELINQVTKLLNKYSKQCKTVTLKIKYSDFIIKTRSVSKNYAINNEIESIILDILKKNNFDNKRIRLLGVTVSNFIKSDWYQPELPFI